MRDPLRVPILASISRGGGRSSRRRGCQCGSGGGGGCGVPARSFPISVMNIYISIYRDTDILFDQ